MRVRVEADADSAGNCRMLTWELCKTDSAGLVGSLPSVHDQRNVSERSISRWYPGINRERLKTGAVCVDLFLQSRILLAFGSCPYTIIGIC